MKSHQNNVHVFIPQSWFGRLVAMVGAIALIALALFYLAVFLATFFMLGTFLIAHRSWVRQQGRRRGSEHVIDAKYSIETSETNNQSKKMTVKGSRLDNKQKRT